MDFDVIQLSKKGFDYIRFDLGELREKRFVAQSVTHDYWATAFQIGEFITGRPTEVTFFTEQQIQCTDDSLLPLWVPNSRSHIPDGLTKFAFGPDPMVLAIEVELNLKPLVKYDKAGYYFDAGLSKVDLVFWVCGKAWIAKEIEKRLRGLKLRNPGIHQFVLMAEFEKHGWDAVIERGNLKGQSVRHVYQTKGQLSSNESPAKSQQTRTSAILFPKTKSPKFAES